MKFKLKIMSHKFGILLQEGVNDIGKFKVVAVPRENMLTIVTKWSDTEESDQSGQSQKVPEMWANGWSVEWFEDSENNECRTAISDAMNAYNAKYVDNKITIDQLIIQ